MARYQEQHRAATTKHERDHAFWGIMAETTLILREEFPIISSEIATTKESVAILTYWVVDRLFRFEISLLALQDGRVGFEVYRNEGGKYIRKLNFVS